MPDVAYPNYITVIQEADFDYWLDYLQAVTGTAAETC